MDYSQMSDKELSAIASGSPPIVPQIQPNNTKDYSQMSDEELLSIANGSAPVLPTAQPSSNMDYSQMSDKQLSVIVNGQSNTPQPTTVPQDAGNTTGVNSLPTIAGTPFKAGAILDVLDAVPNTFAAVGRVIAEKEYTVGQAALDVFDNMVGARDSSPLKYNYEKAKSLIDPNDKFSNDVLDAANTMAELFAFPVAGPVNSVKAVASLARASMKMGGKAVRLPKTIMPASRKIVERVVNSYKSPTNPAERGFVQAVVHNTKSVLLELGGKSVSKIRNLPSATAKRFAARAGDDVGKGGKGIISVEQGIYMNTGKYVSKLNDIFEPLKGKLTAADDMRIQKELREGAVSSDAIAIRSVLDEVGKYALKARAMGGFVKNYLPRLYNTSYMDSKIGREGWFLLLTKYGYTGEEAVAIRRSIVSRSGHDDFIGMDNVGKIERAADGSLKRAVVDTSPAATRERLVNIPDEELAPYLADHHDLYSTLTSSVRSMVRHVEVVKHYGQNYDKLNTMIIRMDKELIRSRKHGLTDDEVNRVYGLADMATLSYKPLTDSGAGHFVEGMNRAVVPAMHVLTLPLATVSSLSEVTTPLIRASSRPSAYLYGLKGMAKHISTATARVFNKNIPKAQVTRDIEDLGIGLDSATMDILTQVGRGDASAISAGFFKFIGLHQWTRAMMVLAHETGGQLIKGHAKDLLSNTGNIKRMRVDLAELGIPPEKAMEWARNGYKTDDPLYDMYIRKGKLKFTLDSVMLPRGSQLPSWHSDPRFRLIAQLKSFPTMYGNTVLKQVAKTIRYGSNKQRAVVVSGITTATMLGMISSQLTDQIRYGGENPRKKNWTGVDYALNGIDRFGGFAAFSAGKDAFNASQYGRGMFSPLLGPSASFAEGAVKTGHRAWNNKGDVAGSVTRQISSMIPFVNVNKEIRHTVAKTMEDLFTDNHVKMSDYYKE